MSKVQSPTSLKLTSLLTTQDVEPWQIERFEDIESWKKARELAKKIYSATLVGAFAKDFGLKDQMRRASVSILSNIAEGFERGGDKEFIQFLAIAKGSAGELRGQLYIALDQNYLSNETFAALCQQATEISQLISGFMKYLKQSDLRGSKLQ